MACMLWGVVAPEPGAGGHQAGAVTRSVDTPTCVPGSSRSRAAHWLGNRGSTPGSTALASARLLPHGVLSGAYLPEPQLPRWMRCAQAGGRREPGNRFLGLLPTLLLLCTASTAPPRVKAQPARCKMFKPGAQLALLDQQLVGAC